MRAIGIRALRAIQESVNSGSAPRTPLKAWMEEKSVSARIMCERMGCSEMTLRKLVNGHSLPSLITAFKLERITEGAVPPVAWLSTPLGQVMWKEQLHSALRFNRYKPGRRKRRGPDKGPRRKPSHGPNGKFVPHPEEPELQTPSVEAAPS